MQKSGGISRYFAELLPKLENFSIKPIFLEKLPSRSKSAYPSLNDIYQARVLPTGLIGRRIQNYKSIDIFHNTYYQRNRFYPKDIPMALTIHDFTPELFPEYFPEGNPHLDKSYLIEKADVIFCVSQTTRNHLMERHPSLKAKVFVTTLATSIASVEEAVNVNLPEAPYILSVGRNDPYKGIETAFKATEYLNQEKLVIYGEFSHQNNKLGFSSSSVLYAGGPDANLKLYMKNAFCLVFPSLSEGFGLPILEAITIGCPVVASDLPVFRELFGDSILYAEAGNPKSFAKQISLLRDPHLREHYRLKGLEKARDFDWQQTAETTSAGYFSIYPEI